MGLIELSDKFPVHLFSSFFHLRWATVSKHSKIYESWKPNPSSLCFLLSSTPKSELSCLIKLQYEYTYPTTYVLLVNAYIALEKINSCKISSFCSLFSSLIQNPNTHVWSNFNINSLCQIICKILMTNINLKW